jgi:hypothetical protein
MRNIMRYGADGRELENVAIEIYVVGNDIHLHVGGRTPKRYLIPAAEWRQATSTTQTHKENE